MIDLLEEIISKIEKINPVHGKKLRKNLKSSDPDYVAIASDFLNKYSRYLKSIGKDFDYAIECYLKVVADMVYEQVQFYQTGMYSSKSFNDVNKKVYQNTAVMEYHMEGLLLSQILWDQHYRMLKFFLTHLPQYKDNIRSYLEIGGGHGLYVSQALKILNPDVRIDVIDISPTAIKIAKQFIESPTVNFFEEDIFNFKAFQPYDFIVMGEVLEHVEDPVAMLAVTRKLLNDEGVMYITVPTNAPAIDHVFLFNSIAEIIDIIIQSGYIVVSEINAFSEDVPREKAEKHRVAAMYGSFIKKNSRNGFGRPNRSEENK